MAKRSCVECGTELAENRRANARFCSRRCAQKNQYRRSGENTPSALARQSTRTCAACGAPIDKARRSNVLYCGPSCAAKAHRARVAAGEVIPADRSCAECGTPMPNRARHAKCCSVQCASRNYARKNKLPLGHIERDCPVCDTAIPSDTHANQVYCSKKCQTQANVIQSYGISVPEYRSRLAAQDHRCAVCGGEEQGLGSKGRGWHIDHDHETKQVRGILCGPCNLTLGFAKDSAATLRAAADYLERSSTNP